MLDVAIASKATFQFHTGSIKGRPADCIPGSGLSLFQFHTGSIKGSAEALAALPFGARFNSTLVRLKAARLARRYSRAIRFNSTLVRLKVMKTATC